MISSVILVYENKLFRSQMAYYSHPYYNILYVLVHVETFLTVSLHLEIDQIH